MLRILLAEDDVNHATLACQTLEDEGHGLIYDYDVAGERTGITTLLTALAEAGIRLKDLSTRQSSLEDIFVELVGARA